jgi:hypothetical protein
MDTRVAVGLIVLTAVGTYAVSRHRHHHFEPTKLAEGAILLDTETGVECSARFAMEWTDADKKAVWAAGLTAQKAEREYDSFIPEIIFPYDASSVPQSTKSAPANTFSEFGGKALPIPVNGSACGLLPPGEKVQKCNDGFSAMQEADAKYNALVKKADSEKVPDPDTSYFPAFPLCKDVR